MEIINNFLEDDYFKNLSGLVSSSYFSWFWSHVVDLEDTTEESAQYNFQFGHTLFKDGEPNSDKFQYFIPILEKLPGMNSLIRMKINLNPKTNKIIRHGYHVDYNTPGKTAVYYFNTCNGYTEFEDTKEIVTSEENKIVIFDMLRSHTGTTCTDSSRRIVLNINYK